MATVQAELGAHIRPVSFDGAMANAEFACDFLACAIIGDAPENSAFGCG